MKLVAINGSPRKTWNTATLLQHVLDGAASEGTETEMVHLYDHTFTGCTSCYACKTRGGKSYGACALRDDLTPVLEKALHADALVLGSPIYFGIVTGMMRCFMERLLFPNLEYSQPPSSLFPGAIPTAFVYTMNISESQVPAMGYQIHFTANEMVMARMFKKPCESFFAYETRQFEDYSKMVFSYCDPAERTARADRQFPIDCDRAYALGKGMIQKSQ